MAKNKFREGEDVVIVRSAYKCDSCDNNHGRYYHGGKLDEVGLQSQGKIVRVASEDKLLLRLKDGREWLLHPDEVDFLDKRQLAKLKRVLPGLERIARHPVFEIAEQTPVFLVDDEVFSLGEGTPQDGENFYEQKKTVKPIRAPLIKVGDFGSLEALLLDRAQPDIEKIGEAYVKEAQRDSDVLRTLDGDLDVPQLIFKQVFPYLQDGHYRNKVSELLGLEEKRETAQSPQKKAKVTKKLEKIADEMGIEVRSLIGQIEQEGEGQEPNERTRKQSKLDGLFDYKESKPCTGTSLLGRALNGRDVAIVEGAVYDLIAGVDGSKMYVQVDGKGFSLVEREEPKREPKTDFEVGDQIRMNAGASPQYTFTKEGSEGVIKRDLGDGRFNVVFTKLTGETGGVPNTFDVIERYMENLSDVVVGNGTTAGDLEDRFLVELGNKVRVDALREHLSRDRIIDLLRTQDEELLAMAGRKEYQGEGFGFVQSDGGDHYAYIDLPAMAIKSEEDGNYYLYDRTKIAIRVSKDGSGLKYGWNMFMVNNNGHPYVHNKDERFAEICQGDAAGKMPTSGRDTGEVIAKRLRNMKEVLMFGYTWKYFDPVHEGRERDKNFEKYRRKLSELQQMNVPIIIKGELKK